MRPARRSRLRQGVDWLSRNKIVSAFGLAILAGATFTIQALSSGLTASWLDNVQGYSDATVRIEVGVNDGGPGSKLHTGLALPSQPLSDLPIPPVTGSGLVSCSDVDRLWVQENGGYEISTWGRMTIFARTKPVVVQNFQVVPVEPARPAAASSMLEISEPCGDGIYEPYLNLSLDNLRPSWEAPDAIDEDDARDLQEQQNPYGMRVGAGESVSFAVRAEADSVVMKWKLRVALLVDGREELIEVEPKYVGTSSDGIRTGPYTPDAQYVRFDSESRTWQAEAD